MTACNFTLSTTRETFCLVASVSQDHQGIQAISHAMVLDTYDPVQDLFIFKNTYDDESSGQPKKFKISRTHPNAPEELFFVHIEIKDMDNLPVREHPDESSDENWGK